MKEDNKLLAGFLNLETTEHNGNLFLTQDGQLNLQFDSIWNPTFDWNQLMQVIEEILEVCAEEDEWEKFYLIKDEIPHIVNTYNECVKFVKNYGKNFN